MKPLTSAMLIALLLFTAASCSKQGNNKPGAPADSGKKYAVKFNVNGDFMSQINDFRKHAANGRTVADSIVYTLYYLVQSQHDHTVIQKSTDPDFGTIIDSLPGGTYDISVLVTNADPSTVKFRRIQGTGDSVDVGLVLPGGDLFAKSIHLTIVGAVNQGFVLNRVVSRVHLSVLDALPYNADHMKITSYYRRAGTTDTTTTDNLNGWANRYDYIKDTLALADYLAVADQSVITFPADQLGKTGWNTYLYIIGTDKYELNLVFTVYSNTNTVLTEKKAFGIDMRRGKSVDLYGNLFNGVGSGEGVHVALPIDTSWESVPKYF